MPNRLIIQCTLANGQKGMIAPTILKWKLDERADAERRYVANPKNGETYAIVEVDRLGYGVPAATAAKDGA
jgi:hypothetical protein